MCTGLNTVLGWNLTATLSLYCIYIFVATSRVLKTDNRNILFLLNVTHIHIIIKSYTRDFGLELSLVTRHTLQCCYL